MATARRAGANGVVVTPDPAAPTTNSRGCAHGHNTPWRVAYQQTPATHEELRRVYRRVHQILFDTGAKS